MKRKVIKVGNSLAITIPKELLHMLQWRDGTHVELSADKQQHLVVKKVAKR